MRPSVWPSLARLIPLPTSPERERPVSSTAWPFCSSHSFNKAICVERPTPPAPPGPVARPHSCACRALPGNADLSPPSPRPARDTETDLRTRLVGGFPPIVPGSVRSTDASRNIYFALPPSLAPPALRATFLYQLRVRKHRRASCVGLQLKVELVRSVFFDSGFAYFQKPFAAASMARVGKTNQAEYKLITAFLAFPSPVAIHLHTRSAPAPSSRYLFFSPTKF